ncbi:MAG: CHASE domain-containing protein [Gammaproteobacteria bacterium]
MPRNAARDSATFLAETLVLALLYGVTAKLGLLFALAPGNVAVIWPPSGIALAAVLVRGYRASVGIWSGAMLVNLIFFSQDPSLSPLAITKASSIATGSLLQALLAGCLYRRAIGAAFPTGIEDVLTFVAIAVPTCGVAATVGTSTLAVAGAIPWGDFGHTGWTWWLGDLAGILILTPPLLLLSHGLNREIGRIAFPVISLGCGLSLIAFYSVWHLENQAELTRFERKTRDIVFALRQGVDLALKNLDAIAAFYAASDRVDRDEFHRFVAPIRTRDSSMLSLAWGPRVAASERGAYEKAARADGYPEFQFTERDMSGALVRATPRPEYFPVYFIEPLQENESALGYDLASDPIRRAALSRALERGQPAATAPIQLLQETGDQPGVVIFSPVYSKHAPASAPATVKAVEAIGVASAVFRIRQLVELALQNLETQGIDAYLFDLALPQGQQLLYQPVLPLEESPVNAQTESDPAKLRSGLYHTATVKVAGREWLIVGKPGVTYLANSRTWLPWGTLISGLLFTALLGAYLNQYGQTEAALRTAQGELEQRLRVRTKALKPAMTALLTQIAQRRRIEKRVRRKEAIFRAFLNTTPAMMWMTDSNGRCIFFNDAWLAFTGRGLREELGLVWTGTEIHPEDRERCITTYRQGIQNRTTFHHRYRLRRQDRAYRWIFEIVTPIFDASGRYEGFIGTASDVTERLEAERMKDEFVSIVSHELRTPLTSIRGALGLLATGSLGRLNDKGRQMLAIAVSNTDRLVRLINEILDLQRMESGRVTIELQQCDAAALVREAVELLEPLAAKAGVAICALLPSHNLRADPDRLVQVLTNLLDNAIKFSERGASVYVKAEINQDYVVMSVKDQGRGIPADKLDRIFERFQQVDASDSRQMGGTGLGLAICESIVQQHGGRIWAESELGSGSTFFFTLPASNLPVDQSTGRRAMESDLSPARTEAA